jgi:hypothetical protein
VELTGPAPRVPRHVRVGLTDFRERRAGRRVERPFPVTVRGVDALGEPLDIDTVVENVSKGGA